MKKLERNQFASFLLAGLCALSAGFVLSACSSSMVSDLDTSECGSMDSYQTRANVTPPYLIITSAGEDLHCALHNYSVPCGVDVNVECEKKGSLLLIDVVELEREDGLYSNCSCSKSIYFTINDVKKDRFDVKVERYSSVGEISVDMKGHETAMINMANGEVLYDKDEPEMTIGEYFIRPDEASPYEEVKRDTITAEEFASQERVLSLSLIRGARSVSCEFVRPFYLPCGAKEKEIVSYIDTDGSLVVELKCDVASADLYARHICIFYIINAREQFHLKLFPHQVTTTDADGTVHEVTTYEYEGDIDFSGGKRDIEITY